MLVSTTCFTGMAAVSKVIGSRATTEEKLFWRSSLSIGFALLGHFACGGLLPERPSRPWLLLLRGICGHIALLAYLEAIERLPLVSAIFLGKIHPLAAAVLSWLFLGEPLSTARVVAIFASLGGVALITAPAGTMASSQVLDAASFLGVALALLAGVLSGAAYCCVRALGKGGETEIWMLLSLPLVSVPCCTYSALMSTTAAARSPEVWAWLAALGLATQGGQVFLARGLSILPAAAGTQTMYFGSIIGVLLGVLFGEGWPTWQVWIGGGIIAASLHGAEACAIGRHAAGAESKGGRLKTS